MTGFVCFYFGTTEVCELPGILANRFSQLKSLNLSHNRLGEFPVSLCEISTLTELNISCNGLHFLPSQIGKLLKWVYSFYYGHKHPWSFGWAQLTWRYYLGKYGCWGSLSCPRRLNGGFDSSRRSRTKMSNKVWFSMKTKLSQYVCTVAVSSHWYIASYHSSLATSHLCY